MAKDNGGSAFPNDGTSSFNASTGMTLRDYFAGQALAGYRSSETDPAVSQWESKEVADMSYSDADAMLKVKGE